MKMGAKLQPRREFKPTSDHRPYFDLLGLNWTKSCQKFKKIYLGHRPPLAFPNPSVALSCAQSRLIVPKKIFVL